MQDNKLNTNAWINITHNSNTYDRTLPRINTIRLITASCTIIPVIIQSIIKCPLNILADNRNPSVSNRTVYPTTSINTINSPNITGTYKIKNRHTFTHRYWINSTKNATDQIQDLKVNDKSGIVNIGIPIGILEYVLNDSVYRKTLITNTSIGISQATEEYNAQPNIGLIIALE